MARLLAGLSAGAWMGSDLGVAQAAPPSFPIYCHAGPSMKVEYVLYTVTTSGLSRVDVQFEKAGTVATPAMPAGQCSWPDRRINADEPAIICDVITAQTQFHGFAGSGSLFPIESHQLGYLPGIYNGSLFYKFAVYNWLDRGSRCLRVAAPVVVENPPGGR